MRTATLITSVIRWVTTAAKAAARDERIVESIRRRRQGGTLARCNPVHERAWTTHIGPMSISLRLRAPRRGESERV